MLARNARTTYGGTLVGVGIFYLGTADTINTQLQARTVTHAQKKMTLDRSFGGFLLAKA